MNYLPLQPCVAGDFELLLQCDAAVVARSFADSGGQGNRDARGILTEKLADIFAVKLALGPAKKNEEVDDDNEVENHNSSPLLLLCLLASEKDCVHVLDHTRITRLRIDDGWASLQFHIVELVLLPSLTMNDNEKKVAQSSFERNQQFKRDVEKTFTMLLKNLKPLDGRKAMPISQQRKMMAASWNDFVKSGAEVDASFMTANDRDFDAAASKMVTCLSDYVSNEMLCTSIGERAKETDAVKWTAIDFPQNVDLMQLDDTTFHQMWRGAIDKRMEALQSELEKEGIFL